MIRPDLEPVLCKKRLEVVDVRIVLCPYKLLYVVQQKLTKRLLAESAIVVTFLVVVDVIVKRPQAYGTKLIEVG
jgi:hypothetical protein